MDMISEDSEESLECAIKAPKKKKPVIQEDEDFFGADIKKATLGVGGRKRLMTLQVKSNYKPAEDGSRFDV